MRAILKKVSSYFLVTGLIFSASAAPATATLADELTEMDQTSIEDDLKDVDLTMYGKNENGRHQLIDSAGFMEYAYSSDVTVSEDCFAIYFYVYNPTAREVSTRAGANVVNMAVSYNAAGEPTEYANCALTVLDHTEDRLIYKFKLTNSAGAYDRARAYASAHGGVRRYDIAGIQLWFSGDGDSTTEISGEDSAISRTYTCTGFGRGCGADNAESTLQINYKKLKTLTLKIQSTWYRTDRIDGEKRKTLSSVYFSVPDDIVEEYGALQIVKCEWYEYKTNYILVSDSTEVINALNPYLGYTLPLDPEGNYYDDSVPFEFYNYIGPSDSGRQGVGWNFKQSMEQLPRYDWLIEVDKIAETVPSDLVQAWAESYPIHPGDESLVIGERVYNANLFSDTVDEGHVRGYNEREFDARDKSQWIDLKLVNQTSDWKRFWNSFLPAASRDEEWLEAHDIRPIEEITQDRVNGNDTTVSNDILVAEEELPDLRTYVLDANTAGERVYILRFSVSDYDAVTFEYHPESDWSGSDYIEFYGATDTVYLAFDIIHLGFVKGAQVTIIPVVSDPIDIYPSLTPTEELGTIDWIFIAVLGTLVAGCVLGLVLVSRMDDK